MGVNTSSIRVIPLVVPLIILAVALAGGYVLMWRLFFLSVLVLLISYLWARLSIHGIEGQIKGAFEYCQVGEWYNEESVISNISVLPKLLLRVWENTDLPGHTNRLAINLDSRGSHRWRTSFYCRRRGRYRMGSLTVEATDPFGLFRAQRTLGEAQSLLVYPATVELPFSRMVSDIGSGSARNYWLTGELSAAVSRVRGYAPGDSLSRIHWRTTAHSGQLMVKDFDLDLPRKIWVVMDMSRSSQAGDNTGTIEEYCATIAASLIKTYLSDGRTVGLITQGDGFYLFPPATGSQHLWRVMEALALVKATGDVSVGQLIGRETRRLMDNSIVVVVTPSVDDEMVSPLLRINGQGAMVIAILLDATSLGSMTSPYGINRRLTSGGIPVHVVKPDDLRAILNSPSLLAPIINPTGDELA